MENKTIEDLKNTACAMIDKHRDVIIGLGEQVWANPETGFKEYKTAKKVAELFRAFGFTCQEGLALTGVRTELRGAQAGPTMALLGEMDAIILPDHPSADPVTGAVHACGHNAQLAGLLGAAVALNQPNILEQLAGRIVFMAVPAEEYLELDFRRQLVGEKKIGFLGGKQELIRLGHFRDVDMAMMIHTTTGRVARTRHSMNGFVAQYVSFLGRAAHAGAAPRKGVNALNAAMLALQALNSQRETLPSHARIHSIIKKGGDSVSTVPSEVLVETMARAETVQTIEEILVKVKRCYHAGALAIGGKVVIESFPGYLPLNDCQALGNVFTQNAGKLVDVECVKENAHLTSSTDMGDVTQIMPASHPSLGGAVGGAHSAEFRIIDPELAYLGSAKVMAMCAIDLLSRQAELARQIIAQNPPLITPDSYSEVISRQFGTDIHDYLMLGFSKS